MGEHTPWLALIEATGDDRDTFLQGQLTQDLRSLDAAHPVRLAASCDAKGRVLAVLTLVRLGDRLIAAIRADRRDDWLTHVLRFRLRARVELAPCADLTLVARAGTARWTPLAELPAPESFAEAPEWGIGTITEGLVPVGDDASSLDAESWRQARMSAKVADVGPAAAGDFTPHMLGLDQVGAISFSKGCYTGQEVVARTEHLGAVKRRAQRVESIVPLEEGAGVLAGDRSAGRIAVASGTRGLAVLPVARDDTPLALEDGSAVTVAD